jgi:hypothetical protein
VWTGFGFAEELCTADAAKPPMHPAAAIGDGLKIGEFTLDGNRLAWKTGIDGPASGSEVLAEPAPTDPCHDGRRRDLIANGSAQASAGNQQMSHCDSSAEADPCFQSVPSQGIDGKCSDALDCHANVIKQPHGKTSGTRSKGWT